MNHTMSKQKSTDNTTISPGTAISAGNPSAIVKPGPALSLILMALHEASTEFTREDLKKTKKRFIAEGNRILNLINELENELK
jgi:hypothetical protein